MTRPKKAIRLGFAQQDDRTPADVQDFARWVFLHEAQRIEPRVLASLADCGAAPATIDAWAARWHLTDPWCLAYATSTRRLWRDAPTICGRAWADRDDRAARWAPRRRSGRAPQVKRDPEHVTWAARYQVAGSTYAAIAREAHRSPEAVRNAVHRLAAYLGLTLRASARHPR